MKIKLVRLVSYIFDRLPILRSCKDKLILSYYRVSYFINAKPKRYLSDFISVPVSSVNCALSTEVGILDNLGRTLAGDWDRSVRLINETDVYRAIESRIENGAAWEGSDYYSRVLGEIEAGKIKWGCKSKDQLDDRFFELDHLIEDVRSRGIVSVADRTSETNSPKFIDDILLAVDRDGKFILHDGRHRLAIAKVLKIKNIPARVSVRHSSWAKFQEEVLAYCEYNGKIYAPILHPDLRAVPSYHTHDRFECMVSNLPLSSGRLLDIGSHWGYFCHQFEALGFDCVAVEPDRKNIYYLKLLRKASNVDFNVSECGVFDLKGSLHFDLVLALYIFHHFLKTEESYSSLKEFLKKLDARHMFFSTHSVDEPQMKGAYKNFSPEDFSDFVMEYSGMTEKKCLWSDGSGRKLYLLSRLN